MSIRVGSPDSRKGSMVDMSATIYKLEALDESVDTDPGTTTSRTDALSDSNSYDSPEAVEPFTGFEVDVVELTDEFLMDIVLVNVSSDLAAKFSFFGLETRILNVTWTDISGEYIGSQFPLTTMSQFLFKRLCMDHELGKRPIVFVAEGTLPETLVKQLLVIISLSEHNNILPNIKGVVLSSPPDSNASLAQFAATFKMSSLLFRDPESISDFERSRQQDLSKIFNTAESLTHNLSYLLALDIYFRALKIMRTSLEHYKQFIDRIIDDVKVARNISTEPRRLSVSAKVAVVSIEKRVIKVTTSTAAQPATIQFRWLCTGLQQALKHIMNVLSLKDKSALANAIRKKELILSVVGPQKEVDVGLMFLYYTLNFAPKSESTQRLIQPKIDTTVPSLLDFESFMLHELKPLSELEDTAREFEKDYQRILGARNEEDGLFYNVAVAEAVFKRPFLVSFFGAPSVGKSTMLNTLLGEMLVFTSIRESTGATTEISHVDYCQETATGEKRTEMAEVVFITPEEFSDVISPFDREIAHAAKDLSVLEKSSAEELGMTTDERSKRIESLQQHEQRLKTRKQLLITLFEQHQSQNKVELDKLEEVLKFIKLEDKKGDASVADIVKKVKLYLDKPLLKYISFMDTPGWNIDSKTFAEDYRLKRSQAQARDADCWLYLTAAYENDPITENIRLMRSITKGTSPGAIAITGFDAVKDEKEKGFDYCVSQKLDTASSFYEAGDRSRLPVCCFKLISEFINIENLKDRMRKGSLSNKERYDLKKMWITFLDFLNSILKFTLHNPNEPEEIEDFEPFNDDDLSLDIDSSKSEKRIEQYVRFLNTKSSNASLGDLAAELSGLPTFMLRFSEILRPRVTRRLCNRFMKLDQRARFAITMELKELLTLYQKLGGTKANDTTSWFSSKRREEREKLKAELSMESVTLQRNLEIFSEKVKRYQLKVRKELELMIDLIINTSDLNFLLKNKRKKKKRKGISDIFLVRREGISLLEYFDHPVREAVHESIAQYLRKIAVLHKNLFGSVALVAPIDYSKISSMDYWLEEAQCITAVDHSIDLRGSITDKKSVKEWEQKAYDSCIQRKEKFVLEGSDHFTKYSQAIVDEQVDIIRRFFRQRTVDIENCDVTLRKDEDSPEVIQNKILAKSKTVDELFAFYCTKIFPNCVKYYSETLITEQLAAVNNQNENNLSVTESTDSMKINSNNNNQSMDKLLSSENSSRDLNVFGDDFLDDDMDEFKI